MFVLPFSAMMASVTASIYDDPAANQIIIFKEQHPTPIGIITTGSGTPVEYGETYTLNKKLLGNEFFVETMTHFVRERIPERVVHAKGGGAFGYFEVTHDMSDICKAKVFNNVGKKTPIAIRFSSALMERGGIDTTRDARGFAIKFYTEEGNLDIVGFNTPMFPFKDPLKFPNTVRSFKKNPVTSLNDVNSVWDTLTLNPETLHAFLVIFGDQGIPDGFRYMPGFGIHTFQVVNQKGEIFFVRFHYKPVGGEKTLTSEEANTIAAKDPDYANRDLYKSIGTGKFPSWNAYIQVLTPNDVKTAGFNIFDISKVLPLDRYPLRRLGRLVLNRNPNNHFAEIEQLAFNPANLVPGICGAPDKLFEARTFAYRDAQYYRLGANFFNIPVNCPLQRAYTYNRDGHPPVNDNQRDAPNYYPNSFNGPDPYKDRNGVELVDIHQEDSDNFDQARDLYVYEMTSDQRSRLVKNIVSSLGLAAKFLQERAIKVFAQIHPDLSLRIYKGLQANNCTS